ncbi:hypothetical protein GCM10010398_20310 [Streptomyces fimbriatus]
MQGGDVPRHARARRHRHLLFSGPAERRAAQDDAWPFTGITWALWDSGAALASLDAVNGAGRGGPSPPCPADSAYVAYGAADHYGAPGGPRCM